MTFTSKFDALTTDHCASTNLSSVGWREGVEGLSMSGFRWDVRSEDRRTDSPRSGWSVQGRVVSLDKRLHSKLSICYVGRKLRKNIEVKNPDQVHILFLSMYQVRSDSNVQFNLPGSTNVENEIHKDKYIVLRLTDCFGVKKEISDIKWSKMLQIGINCGHYTVHS